MSAVRTGRRLVGVLAVAALGLAALTACSSSGKKSLTFCTDPSYAPAEYYALDNQSTQGLKRQLTGVDIDIAKAVSKKIDRTAKFRDTAFDQTIPALLAHKCDAIISFMNDTAQRRTQVSFVDYLKAGQSILQKKSAKPVRSLSDLAGRSVAVARGTTEESFLKSNPSTGFTLKSYASENDAIYAMKKGETDLYFGDSPIVQNVVAADKTLTEGAQLVGALPIGIALRPGDSLVTKVRDAVKTLYGDGTMGSVLARWNFTRYAAPPTS